ncbi:MAG: hypothetical protein Q7R51_00915 [bacterium]|nr:hypothetical protein [bacterium]
MKKFNLIALLTLVYLFLSPVLAHADSISCQPIYGGGQTCATSGNILINKKVFNPVTNHFVDNLGINDPKYQPGSIVNFQLEIKNTGNINTPSIDVKDTLPQYIDFNSGPGSFDQSTKTLSFTIQNLAPNETRTFNIAGKVVVSNQLPANKAVTCVVNQATAITNSNGNSQDNAQFCIENDKGGFLVLSPIAMTTTPATGPESLVTLALLPTGILGWILRKNSFMKGAK